MKNKEDFSGPDAARPRSMVGPIDSLVARALWLFAVLGTVVVAVSVSRAGVVGWRPLFSVHIAALVLLWVVALLRRQLGLKARATALAVLAFALGLSGVMQFAQLGQGLMILVLGCMLIAGMMGMKRGLAAIALCTAVVSLVMLAFARGILALDFDVPRYLSSSGAYLSAAAGFALIGGAAVVLVGAIRDQLGSSLKDLHEAKGELESAEAMFRSVFSQAAVGIVVQSIDGVWLEANDRACELFGRPREEMIGRSFLDVTHPDDVERSRTALRKMADGGADRVFVEKRYLRGDGSVIWANTYASIVRDKEGQPLFHVVVIEDVTDKRRIEDEKRRFYRETIGSVTGGKLLIAGDDESRYYEDASALQIGVASPAQVAEARQRVRDYCQLQGLLGDALELFIVGFGEAMGNALKHAGQGSVFAGCDSEQVWVGAVDKGPGISTFSLPRAALGRGAAASLSMGFGYSIMMNVSDQVLLTTGAAGTRVVLFKRLAGGMPSLQLEDLRDTWDSI